MSHQTGANFIIAEEVVGPAKISQLDVSRIGSIRVTFFRADRLLLDRPLNITERPKAVDELPENVLKGRDIKTNTK